ncbi:hypothetical protein CC80DRAFT_491848 [Byssothecium circinans]|uniref:Uncharacterized protein n=1 Tax=Byssothecium circinans TaxID=147558 RepID=A0A6A5TWG3_9PLEO|nr:hypothetical protein CC80DRAFT_491848 [Byssothecium circinans]
MISGSGSGGGRRPPGNPNNNANFGKSFNHQLGKPSRMETKPRNAFEAIANPDDLIRDIPFPEQAVSDFNGVPIHEPPFRDISSNIIGSLGNPQLHLAEPDWEQFLRYFAGRHHGIANLQDLYVFLTRVALPNAVIINRRLLLQYFLANRNATPRIAVRYDAYNWRNMPYIPLRQERPTTFLPRVQNRPIFRSALAPNGTNMVRWLQTPMNTPPPEYPPFPHQMIHRPSQLDMYLQENETDVRGIHPQNLTRRTVEVFHAWWWVVGRNRWLEIYRGNAWRGMEREVFGG